MLITGQLIIFLSKEYHFNLLLYSRRVGAFESWPRHAVEFNRIACKTSLHLWEYTQVIVTSVMQCLQSLGHSPVGHTVTKALRWRSLQSQALFAVSTVTAVSYTATSVSHSNRSQFSQSITVNSVIVTSVIQSPCYFGHAVLQLHGQLCQSSQSLQ